MKSQLTSKERVLRTIEWKDVDHLPLSINGISHTWVVSINRMFNNDPFKISDYCLELGTDTAIRLYLPDTCPADVGVEYTTRQIPGEKDEILTKTYITPKGKLMQGVRKNGHYPFDTIDIFSDHLVPPGRSYKYMVDCEEELEALSYIFSAPKDDSVYAHAKAYAAEAKKYADDRGVILVGGIDGIGDPLLWLSGLENIVFMGADNPKALHRYIEILSDWNLQRIRVYADLGADTVLRRGWYESTDFWSPQLYREFLLPALKKEVALAHSAGMKYTYIMNSGVDALADLIAEAGVDMQTNAEPETCDIARLRKSFQNRVAMCTGINNYHVLEMGTKAEIEEAVQYAIEHYAPGGGFILCPSDTVGGVGMSTDFVLDETLGNVHVFIDAWKRYR